MRISGPGASGHRRDTRAEPLQSHHVLNEIRVPYFERVLDGFSGKRILDVGCGGGIFAEPLAAAGASVVGIDSSARSIDRAREHAAQAGLEIDYRVASTETFESEERFDAVISIDMLEHVQDLDAAIAACARALRPGGVLGFVTLHQTLDAFELAERLAAQGLPTADITGFTVDSGEPEAGNATTPQASYLGYAVKA